MQTQTTASPARKGIPLNPQEFTRAIAKAQTVNPRTVHIGAHYGVLQSDGKSWAHVVFSVFDGRLFASCTCYAHTRGDHGKPMPCYHIAAAALSKRAAASIVIDPPDEPELNECPNVPLCAPGLCASSCPIASEMAEAAYRHFTHHDAVLVKPEGRDRFTREGWDL